MTKLDRVFLTLICWTLSCTLQAETIDFIADIGLACGNGFDSLSAEVKRVPLKSCETRELPGGQAVEHELIQIESVSQLNKALGLSAEGSLRTGFTKISAKASYMKSHKMDRYSIYLLASTKVKNREIDLGRLSLSDEAKDLLNQPNGLTLFHKAYGDRFVRAISYGGEYFGVLRISSNSKQDKQNIRASISSSGFGWNASGKVQTSLQKYSKTNSMSVKNIINGAMSVRPPTTVAEMIELASRFPQLIGRKGSPIKVVLSDYTVFPEYAAKFTTIETEQKLVLRDIATNYLDYQSIANDLDFIISNADQFRFKDGRHHNETLQLLRQKRRVIQKTLLSLDDEKLKIIERKSKPKTFAELSIPSAEAFCCDLSLPPRYLDHTENMTIQLKPMTVFPLDHVRKGTRVHCLAKTGKHVAAGDTNMYAHKTIMRVHSTLRPVAASCRLELAVTVTMQEAKKDWTTFRKDVKKTILDVAKTHPGLRIKSATPRVGSLWARTGRKAYSKRDYGGGTGLIQRAKGVTTDTKGNDTGELGVRSLVISPIRVEFSHVEDVTRVPYKMVPYSRLD